MISTRLGFGALLGALATAACAAPTDDVSSGAAAIESRAGTEAETARRFEELRATPERLEGFLRKMPKGGDLHNHLSGAIYAESYIRWATEDGACINTSTFAAVPPAQCGTPNVAPMPAPSD